MEAKIIAVAVFLCVVNMYAEQVKMSKAAGSVIRGKGQIHTGPGSRIEVELPYAGGVVRVGSNAAFFFSSDYRNLSLDSGTMMFSAPKDKGGVTIRSGNVISTTTGGSVQLSNVAGRVKVITLDGKVTTSLATNPDKKSHMRPGEMVDVPPGATTIPSAVGIKLGVMIKSSVLINMGPFPALRAIKQNATSQSPPSIPFFVTGGFDPDWGGGSATTIGPAGVAAMVGRMNQQQTLLPPSVSPNAVITQSQLAAFEAAHVPVPASNSRALERSGLVIDGSRIKPQPQPPQVIAPPIVAATPPPNVRPPPVVAPPIATPPPAPRPVVRPPIVRPTPRPPIAVP